MKLLICSFFSDSYSSVFYKSLNKYNRTFNDCGFFVASETCSNWPHDFCISRLKNKCLDAAKNIKPDWMVLLPGCDSSLLEVPNFKQLDDSIVYTGYRKNKMLEFGESCSLHMYSSKIYNNYRYDENFCFFYDDYDFYYNQLKDLPKQKIYTLNCFHEKHDSLPSTNPVIADKFNQERNLFIKKYFSLHGKDFHFE